MIRVKIAGRSVDDTAVDNDLRILYFLRLITGADRRSVGGRIGIDRATVNDDGSATCLIASADTCSESQSLVSRLRYRGRGYVAAVDLDGTRHGFIAAADACAVTAARRFHRAAVNADGAGALFFIVAADR